MDDDLTSCYKTLELEPGASLEEINQAYKDLALVWHPDRLPQDSLRLQEKAQAKLKEINNARERLREDWVNRSIKDCSNRTSSSSPTSHKRESANPNSQRQQPRRSSSPQAAQATQNNTQTPPPQTQTPAQRPDLTGVDWSARDLKERDFSNRNLTNANLSNTNLQDAFLHGTNLHGANLYKANLFRANLFQANLSYTNLRETNLIGADLSGANLTGADLTGAKIKVGGKMTVRLIGANLTDTIMPDGNIYWHFSYWFRLRSTSAVEVIKIKVCLILVVLDR